MEALSVLTSIAIILLLGLVITIISKRLRISNVLLLVLVGVGLKAISYKGEPVFEFNPVFLISISILALVMIIFDGSSRFKIREIDTFSADSLKLVLLFIVTNTIIITIFTTILFYPEFSIQNILFSFIFAVMMAATDPASVFSILKSKVVRTIRLLEIEAIINTPIIVIVPFIVLDFLAASEGGQIFESFVGQTVPFLKQIIIGIGAGVVVGIIIFKAMRNFYHHDLSPLAIITAALISYILAENLGGSGVLSVATMGLFFGNMYVKKKITLKEFSSIFSNALEILVFLLVGFLISIDLSLSFFIKSAVLFILLIVSRWCAVTIALKKSGYKVKEELFIALNMPKGIAVAAVVFSFSVKQLQGLEIIMNLALVFIVYSLVLSAIVDHYAKKFINVELEP
ncbi:MAG: cation:proton antiporter [Nanoarchaeota archaeon]|nr:cation:proton antiporter [Nanoarchaeota archaeon]MBU1269347.1 cation:proton antiporter [Nanoarchaeota archaeon]MBU1603850.1 cation:proton antiporter [Nanoarchaeota archaeon]MBU2443238.1 cation:proton antiporter [Nanoarchaeota archaeon]